MFNLIKEWRRMPTSDEIAIRQLEETKLALLGEQKAAEYHQGMVDVLQKRIKRLEDRTGITSKRNTDHVVNFNRESK